MSVSQQGSVSRARWAAIGAAVAVSIGVGGVAVTHAVVGKSERADATSVAMKASVSANAVGSNADGTRGDRYYTKAEVDSRLAAKANAADVYTKSQSDTQLATKANAGNVYTKAEIDAMLSANVAATDAKLSADITVNNGLGFFANPNYGPAPLGNFGDVTRATANPGGLAIMTLPLIGPKSVAGVTFRFSSMTYCIKATGAPAYIDFVSVGSTAPPPPVGSVGDATDRTAAGCYTVSDPTGTLAASTSILMGVSISGTTGYIDFTSVTSTWTPVV